MKEVDPTARIGSQRERHGSQTVFVSLLDVGDLGCLESATGTEHASCVAIKRSGKTRIAGTSINYGVSNLANLVRRACGRNRAANSETRIHR
jgi:hypothetical protein